MFPLRFSCNMALWFMTIYLIGSFYFSGIKHEWQVNGLEDLKERHTLADKLGGASVVSLEGSPI